MGMNGFAGAVGGLGAIHEGVWPDENGFAGFTSN